jgi:predicted lipoprotein with Yx(FWY)xxD motif
MNYLNFKVYNTRVFAILLMATFVLTGACSDDDDKVLLGLKLNDNETFGNVISDSKGMSLYFFANDASGTSTCSGACATTWPPFLLQDNNLPQGLLMSDLGEITRTDGTKQTTYKGWPLYYFNGDVTPGTVNGDGSGGSWFVAKPDYTLMLARINSELVFVGSRGKAVYTFDNDAANVSNCNGGCAVTWPPYFYGETIVLPSALNANNFGTITRADGTKQNTYIGKALYLYNSDVNRGTLLGDGVGGVWHKIVKN